MKMFTIIAYVLSAGGHAINTGEGKDATDAVVRLRERLKLQRWDFEVVAVVQGRVALEPLDDTRVARAPERQGI